MRYVTFALTDSLRKPRLGALRGDLVIDLLASRSWAQGALALSAEPIPPSLLELIHLGSDVQGYLSELLTGMAGVNPLQLKGAGRQPLAYPLSEVVLYPPLPRPMSLRDFYAFEDHVRAVQEIRQQEVPQEWYQAPAFYFANVSAIYGPEETVPYPSYSRALDYELEVACVIGRQGRNIPADQADQYVFGYTVFNDWSARDEQRREVAVGLGPGKGKDFASSLGPALVTGDELADRQADRPGVFDLSMTARVNGETRSQGNWNQMHFSFGEMIARASTDVFLMPGDVIGSGTVGSGSLLELTGGQGPWLQAGDVVELEIEQLGVLRNRVGDLQGTRPLPSVPPAKR